MPKIFPRYAQYMPKICPRYAQDMPKICPRYAQDMTTRKTVLTKRLPDKTSKPVLTKCLPEKPSKVGRSWQKVFLTKCLRRSWQNVFLAKRPTWQNEFWDFTFRKHEPHFLNRNIPKQDRANTKQCISIYWTLDRREIIFVKERRARGQSGQEPGCWNSN